MDMKNSIDIVSKINYLVDVPLIINANIVEYDISKANINMLLSYGMITIDEYNRFFNMDKMTREISIGRRMKDENNPDILTPEGILMQKNIKEGIMKAKTMLVESNKVIPETIMRVANDAVYINGPRLQHTSFDINNNGVKINFKCDKVYNIMLNLNTVTIFIYDNPMADSLDVEVKGINDDILYKHEAFLGFICSLVTDMQRNGKEATLYRFNDFYERYVNMALPIDYYREFNSGSGFNIKGSGYIVDALDDSCLSIIDINYNLWILRELYSIILDH